VSFLLKLKFTDEPTWLSVRSGHFVDAQGELLPGVQLVVLGTLYRETGNVLSVAGMGGNLLQVPEQIASDGWHVDAIMTSVPTALHQYLVNPVQPKHLWANNYALAMPEPLPEAEEVALVSREIGENAPEEIIARIDRAVLKGRITKAMAENRKALLEARIKVTEIRIQLGDAKTSRRKMITELDAASSIRADMITSRTVLTAERQAQEAIRVQEVEKIRTLNGKARQDAIAARDEAIRLRDEAKASADAINTKLTAHDINADLLRLQANAAADIIAQKEIEIEIARSRRTELRDAIGATP
jgi:hypothetical protein